MSLTNKAVIVYTDGSSRGNPGPGGYGVLLIWGNTTKELSQGYRRTTNNRMELMAVIAALQAIKKDDQHLIIHSDSSYVVKAIEEGWLKNWIKINLKDKKNKDLWMLYHQLSQKHHVKLKWVKGHAENIYNNRCDELATEAADGKNLLIDEGYENG